MAKFKELYSFDVYKNLEVEETETTKNEAGEEIKVTKKVKKDVPVRVAIKKPSRSEVDDAELFYGVRLAEGIKAGLMSKALLAKRFNNDGGTLSEQEREEYSVLYLDLFNAQNDFQRMSIKDEAIQTEEEKVKLATLISRIAELRKEIQDFEMAQNSVFENCAENRARSKTILWWILSLSYFKNEKGEWTAFFVGDNFDEKIADYDVKEEGDDLPETEKLFYTKAVRKLAVLVSFWYYGLAQNPADFDKLLSEHESA